MGTSASAAMRSITRMRRMRWSETEAEQVLGWWRDSGLTMAEFCRRHELSAERLGRWKARLAQRSRQAVKSAPPVRSALVPATVRVPPAAVVVRLSSGVEVEVSDCEHTPAAWLGSLLAELNGLSR